MTDATAVAQAVLDGLVGGGVTDVVLAPGSRSAPLAVAIHVAQAAGSLRLHVRIDERTAGFLALGLAKTSGRPVPVVVTSGTAVANLHPAVLEAVHAGVPLIVLSADRPARLRGTGANQTTEQAGLFGTAVPCVDVPPAAVRTAEEAVTAALQRPGPSQVNVQFDIPLLAPPGTRGGTGQPAVAAPRDRERPRQQQRPGQRPRGPVIPLGPRTVVIAGDDAGPPARMLAESADWPLLAEPTSGARTGTHALRTATLLLQTGLVADVERVIVTGHPTLSRPMVALLSRTDVEVLAVRGPAGVCTDPARLARHLDAVPRVASPESADWLHRWRAADRRLTAAVDDLVADDPAALPLRIAAEVAAAVAPGGLLIVGSSQPVRDLDLMAPPYPAHQRRKIIGNRGLSGIDGTVSTAVGAALGRDSTHAIAYMGDLTFLHDATALLLGPEEPCPDLTVVVANDDGGAVFASLEQGAPEYADGYERVFGTAHHADLAALCAATGTPHQRIDGPEELRTALAGATTGIRVLEVPVPRHDRRRLSERIAALAREVLG